MDHAGIGAPREDMRGADLVLMVGICLVWAANAIACRSAVADLAVPPLFFATARFAIAAVVLAPCLRPLPSPLGPVLLAGLLVGAGHFGFLFAGFRIVEPSTAAIILQVGVPFTALLSALLLHERVGARRWVGIGVAIAGVVVVLWRPSALSVHGAGLIVCAAASLALGSVLLKRLPTITPLRMQAWASATSVLPLFGASLVLEPSPLESLRGLTALSTSILFGSALIVTGGSHTLYYGLLRRYPASVVAPLTLLFPILTVALSAVASGETPGLLVLFGMGLTIGGVRLVLRHPPGVPESWAPSPADGAAGRTVCTRGRERLGGSSEVS